jgi:uncharacterized membrane-anchored protein
VSKLVWLEGIAVTGIVGAFIWFMLCVAIPKENARVEAEDRRDRAYRALAICLKDRAIPGCDEVLRRMTEDAICAGLRAEDPTFPCDSPEVAR